MSSGQIEDVVTGNPYSDSPEWMQIAEGELGQKETDPYSRVAKYFEICGVTPDPRGTPWCRYFLNYCLIKAHWTPPLDGMARGLLKWGDEVTDPKVGDIAILWRGTHDDGVTGHTGFFIKQDGKYVYLLGGNQGDAVTEAKFDKNKVLAYRRPRSMLKSKTNWAAVGVKGLGGVELYKGITEASPAVVEQATDAKSLMEQALSYFPNYKIMLGVLIISLGMYILWNKKRENKEGK